MNNFPAMTEEQRELEIASVKEMRSHVDFWGHASGLDAEFLMRCADAYLAMLTTEPVGEVVSMKATVLDGMIDVSTTKVIRNASSIKRLPSGTKLFTTPPAPVLRVPDGWKLVPIEPTEAMMLNESGCQHHAWDDANCPMRESRRIIWKHMIETAPEVE